MLINIDRFSRCVVSNYTPFCLQIEVSGNLNITKTIQTYAGMIQKLNDKSEPLYMLDEKEETTQDKIITKWEEKPQVVKILDQDGNFKEDTIVKKIPVEWINNEPVMISKYTNKIIEFKDDPSAFNLDDIVTAKYRNILEKSTYDYIIAQEFIEQNIDVSDKDHAANIGVGFVQLLPKGQAKTHEIELDEATSIFQLLSYEGSAAVEIYINNVKVQNNKVLLPDKTNKIVITFKNPTDRDIILNAYSIGY